MINIKVSEIRRKMMTDKDNNTPKRPEQLTLYFTKIIKTKNLSEKLSSKLVADLESEELYKPDEDNINQKNGFYDKFIYKKSVQSDFSFLGIENEFWTGKPQDFKISKNYESGNENHAKLDKLCYIKTNIADDKSIFVDIFLVPSFDLIFVCGAESHSKKPIKLLENKLNIYKKDKKLAFDWETININPSFLLWLVYKKKLNPSGNINENLKLQDFKKFETEKPEDEDEDNVSENILTVDNNRKDLSFPIIYGIINKLIISELKGKFIYRKARFTIGFKVDIKKDESLIRIHSANSIRKKDYSQKIKLSLPFLNNLLIEYFKWNKLKSSEKIPDITFIDELKDKLFDEYSNTIYNFIGYRENHCKKLEEKCPKIPPIYLFDNNCVTEEYPEKVKKKIEENIKYLVDKNVLLSLQNK
jgi:hypothetical protein